MKSKATKFNHEIIGKIDVNPYRAGLKNNPKHRINIVLPNDFMDYYRQLAEVWSGIELQRPNHDCHVTALKRNTFDWREARKLFQGKEVRIQYSNTIRYSGDVDGGNLFQFLFLNCVSQDIANMQLALRHPVWKQLHITIAKPKHPEILTAKDFPSVLDDVSLQSSRKGFFMRKSGRLE